MFHALGCRDLGRVDLRLTPEDELFVLEMNTIPGFTETSLLPKAAADKFKAVVEPTQPVVEEEDASNSDPEVVEAVVEANRKR